VNGLRRDIIDVVTAPADTPGRRAGFPRDPSGPGMGEPVDADLLAHLTRTTGLGAGEAARVVADVLAYFSETTEEYVRRRHTEMQVGGLRNEEIFARLETELAHRRVAPPMLTPRQIRRVVYG
jgi:hypothetical protein